MTQSKPIQRIVIPTVKDTNKDSSFHLFKFLFNKSKEGGKSNCPIRGSLSNLKDKPLISFSLLFSLIAIFSMLFRIHIF